MRLRVRGNPFLNPGFLVALPRHLRLYVRLMRDPRVRMLPKMIVVGALVYALSPLDLMPDYLIPVVGQIDDILILWLAFRTMVRMSPPEVVAEHLNPPAR